MLKPIRIMLSLFIEIRIDLRSLFDHKFQTDAVQKSSPVLQRD
jgi:hypothetical protein